MNVVPVLQRTPHLLRPKSLPYAVESARCKIHTPKAHPNRLVQGMLTWQNLPIHGPPLWDKLDSQKQNLTTNHTLFGSWSKPVYEVHSNNETLSISSHVGFRVQGLTYQHFIQLHFLGFFRTHPSKYHYGMGNCEPTFPLDDNRIFQGLLQRIQ